MNLVELEKRVLMRARRDDQNNSRRQAARDIINDKIQEILSANTTWPFLHFTTDLYSVSGTSLYNLPPNFAVLESAFYDGDRIEMFRTGIEDRYGTVDNIDTTFIGGTIRRLSESALVSTGTCYPTYGSDAITGVGTSFDPSHVNRFFKSQRDGELYRIKAVGSATSLTLQQEYGGKSQVGRVSVYSTDPTQVFGNPSTTNFTEEMVNRRMQIEGNGATTFLITSVDEINQVITIGASSITGTDLIYSVQDSYQIDPPGAYVFYMNPAPTANNLILQIDYVGKQLPLTGPIDVPLIPEQYHWVIVAGAQADFLAIDGGDPSVIGFLQQRYNQGIQALLAHDPMEFTDVQGREPDTVRLRRVNRAR